MSRILIGHNTTTVSMEADEDGDYAPRDLIMATLAAMRAIGHSDYAEEMRVSLERDGWSGL